MLAWKPSRSRIALELTGLWRAELVHNREGKLLPEEIAALCTDDEVAASQNGETFSDPWPQTLRRA